jgi:Ca2+-binding RTX toxin-like protein
MAADLDMQIVEQALRSLYQSTQTFAGLAFEGGYAGAYSFADGRQFGEAPSQPLGSGEVWLQPPGTPRIGEGYLRSYTVLNDQQYLDAAIQVGQAIAFAQKDNGGWSYTNRMTDRDADWLLGDRTTGVSLDDNVTQGNLGFLMKLDVHYDAQWLTDSIGEALDFLVQNQGVSGGWAHSYPAKGDYRDHFTFADSVINNAIDVLWQAHTQYADPVHLQSTMKGVEFILQTQLSAPQAGWAQFYDSNLQPASGRFFEPEAVDSLVTAHNIRTLIAAYQHNADQRYVDAAQAAVNWLKQTELPSHEWYRLSEIGTGTPIFVKTDGTILHTVAEMEAAKAAGELVEYGWLVSLEVQRAITHFDIFVADPEAYVQNFGDSDPLRLNESLEVLQNRADDVGDQWDLKGWKTTGYLDPANTTDEFLLSADYDSNSLALQRYLKAARLSLDEQGRLGEWNAAVAAAAAADPASIGAKQYNLTGTDADDALLGGSLADVLIGGGGSDKLSGGRGADRMEGGLGDDFYNVDDPGDLVVELANAGTDTIFSSTLDVLLPANVENAQLFGSRPIQVTGNGLANLIFGNTGNNTLNGEGGDDRLYGRAGDDHLVGGLGADRLFGDEGADRMEGGLGDDLYYVDDPGDTALEKPNEGTDSVFTTISFSLIPFDSVENITINGAGDLWGTGNGLDNIITGNASKNTLIGAGGDDRLYGGGGDDRLLGSAGNDRLFGDAGADRMEGGLGDDLYYVDDPGDTVLEKPNEGTDSVFTTISFSLVPFDNVENITINGAGDLWGTGNGLDNIITGNASKNTLIGAGGDDRLYGGGGDDRLLGSAGNDRLFGDAGADRMEGGLGDDLYYVDNPGDTVLEKPSEGTDSVFATISFSLSAFLNVENVTLQGSGPLSGTGNALNNTLTGNSAANTLSGEDGDDRLYGREGDDILIGGAGADRLEGGAGNDRFVFANGSGIDQLIDFTPGVGTPDVIDLAQYAGISSFQDVLNRATQLGTTLAIDLDVGDRLLLSGVTTAQLHADDFYFGS